MKSLFLNYIKQINESTAEDRYRKSKSLQPLEELSEYEALERYAKDDSIMISFRDEYHTQTNRIGLNLKSYEGTDKATPNGIYCYPLKKIWPYFTHKDKAILIKTTKKRSFFIPSKPAVISVLKLKYDNCLDFRKYDSANYEKDINNLYDKYVKTKTIEQFKKEILSSNEKDIKNLYDKYVKNKDKTIEQFKKEILSLTEEDIKNLYDKYVKDKILDIEQFKKEILSSKEENSYINYKIPSSKNNKYYSNMIWLAIFYVYKKILNSSDVNVFTRIIKDMGYNSVYDTYGIIHTGVTIQAIIFKQEAYELIENIKIKGPKSNNFDSFFRPTIKKDSKIYKLITELLGDKKNINKIKSLLKNLDDINYHDKTQEPLIHYFINYDKPELVKELVSYQEFNPNIRFKDYYINPIMFAIYKNQTEIVEMLLATNKLKNFKNIKNVFGKTALDMANDNKNKKIIELLTQ